MKHPLEMPVADGLTDGRNQIYWTPVGSDRGPVKHFKVLQNALLNKGYDMTVLERNLRIPQKIEKENLLNKLVEESKKNHWHMLQVNPIFKKNISRITYYNLT